MRLLVLVAFSALAFGSSARLYDLDTGKMVTLEFKGQAMAQPFGGHGEASGTVGGKKVSGEYQTTNDGPGLHGNIIMIGDGIVLDCEYSVTAGHGSGSCTDNQKKRYRLML